MLRAAAIHAADIAKNVFLGPPGWCSGCWPHDGEVAGGAVAISF
jgi:hypothetical protein